MSDSKLLKIYLDTVNARLRYLSAGLVSCYPGWCTGYAGPDQTKTDILEGIRSEREYIKTIPTWYQLRVAGEV